jgi:hypothetical protein
MDSPAVRIALLLQEGKEVELEELGGAIIHLRRIQGALHNLHGKLDLLSGKTENQVTYDFIRKLGAETSGRLSAGKTWLRTMPSIALTDNYNFVEYDLRHILSNEIQRAGVESSPMESTAIVLALPKVECENPLMWAILAHELGHAIMAWWPVKQEILSRSKGYREAERDQQELYDNWISEICSDLIALRLLGPSYFFSLASMDFMALPYSPARADHPSIIARMGTMEKVLKQGYPTWRVPASSASSPAVVEDGFAPLTGELISLFVSLADYNNTFRAKVLSHHRGDYVPTLSNVNNKMLLAMDEDLIVDELERHRLPINELGSPEVLEVLHGRLSEGQPACSQAPVLDKDKFQADLIRAGNSDEIYGILPGAGRPYTLASILAAGWMLKIYTNYGDLWREVRSAQSIMKTMSAFEATVTKRNTLLQSSLTRAFVMQMYWRWRDERQ